MPSNLTTTTPLESAATMWPARADDAFKIVSALPGRVRLRFGRPYSTAGHLHGFAAHIAAQPAVSEVEVIPEASSVLVIYDRKMQDTPAFVTRLRSITAADFGANGTAVHQEHVHQKIRARGRAAAKNGASGARSVVHAEDIPLDTRHKVTHMVMPTVAVAASALNAPPVIVVALVAIAAIPLIKRVLGDAKRREFTSDELDLLNIGQMTFEASYFPASAIIWLTSLGDLARRRTFVAARKRHHKTITDPAHAHSPIPHEGVVEFVSSAVLNDSALDRAASKTHKSVTGYFVALAVAAPLVTQDFGLFMGVLKPLYDFMRALRFGMPVTMLSAMAHASRHGALVRSGRAVDALARFDAIVFFTVPSGEDAATLRRHMGQLMRRGVECFVFSGDAEVEEIRSVAKHGGHHRALVEPMPEDRSQIVTHLIGRGYRVGVVEGGNEPRHWTDTAAVRIHAPEASMVEDIGADVVLRHRNLRSLAHAIDVARHALLVTRQNVAMSTTAALVNLSLAFVPPLPATMISTAATVAISANSSRLPEDEEDLDDAPAT